MPVVLGTGVVRGWFLGFGFGLAFGFAFGFFRTTSKPAISKTTKEIPPPRISVVFDEVPNILSSSV